MHNGEVKWVFGFYPKKFWAHPKICKSTNWGTQINLIHSDRKKNLFLNHQIKYYTTHPRKMF